MNRKLEKAACFIAINYQGLNSLETYDLRKTLRDGGVKMHVVPNRVAMKVLPPARQNGSKGINPALKELFKGPTALLVGKEGMEEQVIAAAKVLAQWQKKNKDKLGIKGGLFSGHVLGSKEVLELARFPDRRTLLAQVAGLFQAPVRNLAVATQQILGRVVYALQAIKDNLENKEKETSKS
ncbi:MAG: 50S ribosomal protein L10 [Planctomycetes bacterium]|nr:50S ribosomal protein L10 [Planctomycetota bacterium]